MNANMKKWMTVVAVVVATMVVAMSGGNAEAKKDTATPNTCGQCASTLRSGTIVCKLVSCESGCQYTCTDLGPIAHEQ